MIADALIYLIDTAALLFTVVLLLRFLMQWARAAPRNPISDFTNAMTNWAVLPTRRLIPGLWGMDLATLLLALLVQFLQLFLVLQLSGYELGTNAGLALIAMLLLAALDLIRYCIYIIFVLLFLQMILSWLNPYSAVAPVVTAITRPFLRPFQKRMKPVGNVDLSPLVLAVVCQLLLMVPIAWASAALTRML